MLYRRRSKFAPSYRQDLFLTSFDFALPLLLMLAFIYSVGVFVKVCTYILSKLSIVTLL